MATKELIIESERHGTHTILYDEEDEDKIKAHKWGILRNHNKKSRPTYKLYITTTVPCESEEWIINATDGGRRRRRRHMLLHRYLLNAKEGELVDHIDGNPLNNTKINLRVVTARENAHNTIRKKNKTGYIGVNFDKRSDRYVAQIRVPGRRVHIGCFGTKEEAAKAYDRVVCENREVVNPEHQLNFPELKEQYLAEIEEEKHA